MKLLFTLAISVTTAFYGYAQMDSCNVFLQGKYVELGISPSGSYGSSVTQPAGYHGNSTGSSEYHPCSGAISGGIHLGFIADPDMDGWVTGTPAFYGDYFLPGSPYEGWLIEVNGVRSDAHNMIDSGYTHGLTGANVSYTSSGGVSSSVWQGTLDSIAITQVTTLDTNNLYFTVTVTLTNNSSTAINDIYYLRTLDPDNEQMETGNFQTHNKIEYQLPNTSNATVVSAAGTTYSAAYLALGTADTNAKCLIYYSWPIDTVSIASIYNETATSLTPYYGAGDTTNGDLAIGLAYKIAHLAPADSASDSVNHRTTSAGMHPANNASFTYFYAFSHPAVDSALKAGSASSLGIININNSAAINVYPNPSKDIITVTGLTATDQLALYDMMGRAMPLNKTGSNVFSLSKLPAGAYILIVKDPNGAIRSRVPIRKL